MHKLFQTLNKSYSLPSKNLQSILQIFIITEKSDPQNKKLLVPGHIIKKAEEQNQGQLDIRASL